jgi:hypothetical protein
MSARFIFLLKLKRASRADAPGEAARSWDRAVEYGDRWTVPRRGGRSRRPARCSTRVDLDAAIEVDRAHAEAVVAERLERQRPECRPILGKHRRDLALGRAVNPCIGPARVPAIELRLRVLDRLEAHALQRRLLRVADPGFNFAFAIGIADATRHRDHAVVREDAAIGRSAPDRRCPG